MAINATLLETLDRIIEEDFGSTIQDAVKDIDPFSKNLLDSTMGVTREGLGRGWKKIQVFKTGLAGAASWRSVTGPTSPSNTTAATQQFMLLGTPQTFPGLTESTVPAYVQANATLKEMYGIFHMPIEIMRADQTPTNIGNQVEAIIEGAARRASLREILAFWAESNGAYFAGTKSGTTTIQSDGTIASSDGEIDSSDGLTRYHLLRFQEGECFDIFESNGGTWSKLTSDGPVFVQQTDDLGVTMRLAAFHGGTDITLTDTRSFELHPYNSSSTSGGAQPTTNQPSALASWIKSSGTVFGLALADYPFFKSLVKALSGGETTLSEAVLNRYVGGLLTAKPTKGRIDKLITTPGVKSKYVNNIDFVGRRDRWAVPVKLNEGYSKEWDYQRDGYELMVETSAFCPKGTLYGLRTRDGNLQKITPPSPPGVGKHSAFGSYVDFIAKISGPSIFTMTRPSGNSSDYLEAPFKRWVEFMPQSIPGLKLTSLDEDIATS